MAYCITHFFPGGTKAQYEAVMVAINGELGAIPPGQILHLAGPVPGGWQVTAVQESKESWDAFVAERFLPVTSRGIEGGFAAAPTETGLEVAHLFRPSGGRGAGPRASGLDPSFGGRK
jgi:hypothetical protein